MSLCNMKNEEKKHVMFLKNIFFVHRSVNKPEVVVANLIKSNIIVDSILLGKVENNILRGISKATGT